MITCNIMGGLGNQLFQIFATIAYALNQSEPFLFTYAKMFGKRPAYWDTFLYPLRKFTTLNRIQGVVLREKGFHYEELPSNSNKLNNAILYGYFQSEKYFQEHVEEIAEMAFNLKEMKQMLETGETSSELILIIRPTKGNEIIFALHYHSFLMEQVRR